MSPDLGSTQPSHVEAKVTLNLSSLPEELRSEMKNVEPYETFYLVKFGQ